MFFGWQGVATFIFVAAVGVLTMVFFARLLEKAE